ncbi:hypothetical protein H8E52_05045 [bacterium]|nr:hypothetical protein [bacterium]
MTNSEEYLYRIQPTRPAMLKEGPSEEEADLVSKHFAYLQELTASGHVLLAGRTQNDDPSSFGIVIFRAESKAAALKVFQGDPAVAGGVFQGELFPFKIALTGELSD